MQKRLMENSTLMFECNNLRRDKLELQRKLQLLQDKLKRLSRQPSSQKMQSHASAMGENDSSFQSGEQLAIEQHLLEEGGASGNDDNSLGAVSSLGDSIRKAAHESADAQMIMEMSNSASLLVEQGEYRQLRSGGGMLQQAGKLPRSKSGT